MLTPHLQMILFCVLYSVSYSNARGWLQLKPLVMATIWKDSVLFFPPLSSSPNKLSISLSLTASSSLPATFMDTFTHIHTIKPWEPQHLTTCKLLHTVHVCVCVFKMINLYSLFSLLQLCSSLGVVNEDRVLSSKNIDCSGSDSDITVNS